MALLFEPRGFADILADVVPWLETFCEPVEAKASGDVHFWVRDSAALGLQAFDPAGVGVFFLSEDEEMPAEDEDYSAFSRPPVQGLIVGAGCSGSVNHVLLGHLTLALARRFDALVDFDGLLSGHPTAGDDLSNEAVLAGREHWRQISREGSRRSPMTPAVGAGGFDMSETWSFWKPGCNIPTFT